MQQLKSIPYYKDITHSASLTGITVLKKSRFKVRHKGSKLIVEKPIEGIILKSQDLLEIERLASIVKRPRKKIISESKPPVKRTQVKAYQLNKKEISHRIRGFINQQSGKKELYFWTITFPEGTSDTTAFILLNKWLTRLRKERMLKTYLWVSERQQNGTIHFHMAVNHRMDIKRSNRFMRACIFTCIDNKEIKFSRYEAMKYNGVDISKDRKTKRVTNFAQLKKSRSLISYITKYVTKNNESFPHLAWHCSRDYSNLIIGINITESEFNDSILSRYIDYEKPFENEWITFYRWKLKPPDDLLHYFKFINNLVLNLITNQN